jgi:two-component system cell cycle response regulator
MTARVLVVDDIFPNVKLLEAKLMSEYFDVITAQSGAEALEKVESENPDIVLLDVMMPGMDGYEVCQRIKDNPATAHIPVVMVTALTDAADRNKGLQVGADDFLSKPINDVALMACVKSLVRLKMTLDEWRARETTATTLGVMNEDDQIKEIDLKNAHVLYIDDQTLDVNKINEVLGTYGHTVHHVQNGQTALEQVSITSPELIMISIDLGGEDGLRLCSQLRSNEKTRQIPILMIANDGSDMKRIAKGLEIGANGYIIRPLDRTELAARVRNQIRRKRYQDYLKSTYEESLSMALKDSLTGLFNRRYINVHLETLLKQTGDLRKNLAVLIMDIDHFKAVNDTHGHNIGDEVLKVFAERIRTRMRGFDLLARTGGEEFVVALVDVTVEKACFIAERLRRAIEKAPFPTSDPAVGALPITVSIGGAYLGQEVVSIEEALDRADKQLYAAKENGRNAVHFEQVGKVNPEEYKEAARVL